MVRQGRSGIDMKLERGCAGDSTANDFGEFHTKEKHLVQHKFALGK